MALAVEHRDRMELDCIWERFDEVRAMCDEGLAFARGDASLRVRRVYLNRFWDQMSHRVFRMRLPVAPPGVSTENASA